MRKPALATPAVLALAAAVGFAISSCSADSTRTAEAHASNEEKPVVSEGNSSKASASPPVSPEPHEPGAPASPPASQSNRAQDPLSKSHYLFVGTPTPQAPLDCEIFETSSAPHRRPPRGGLHDATDYPERHGVSVEIVEVLQNPSGVGLERHEPLGRRTGPPRARVAFALDIGAFRAQDMNRDPTLYDKKWCEHLNRWLSSKYIVVHAYPIHVDRGNSASDPWRDAWESIGTDPGKRNGGFDTLEEARAYARRMTAETDAGQE